MNISPKTVAHLLHLAVKKASVPIDSLHEGDHIVVTAEHSDLEGIVVNTKKLVTVDGKDSSRMVLATFDGNQINFGEGGLRSSGNIYIHIIHTADEMLALRKHYEYERDLKDMTKVDHQHDGRPEYGPVETSEKSELTTSKISHLNLRLK